MKLTFPHDPIPAGRVISISHDGVAEWESPKAMQVAGSYDQRMFIRSQGELLEGRASELFISGNPAKFLQGHNVFGCESGIDLAKGVVARVESALGIGPVPESVLSAAELARVDFTRSIQFDSQLAARAYISQVSLRSRTRSGRGVVDGWTCTFQKRSRRWSLVVYSKWDELRAHPLPDGLDKARIEGEAEGLVRVELRLRSLELTKLGLRRCAALTPERLNAVYDEYLGKVEMSTNVSLTSDVIENMPRYLRDTYLMHKNGCDVRRLLSRASFYRHRSELMGYGVDIAVPFDSEAIGEVIPMSQILTGRPYCAPEWAYRDGYIYQAA